MPGESASTFQSSLAPSSAMSPRARSRGLAWSGGHGPEPDVARIRRAPGRKRGTYGQITVNGVVFLRGRSVRVDAHVVEYTKVLKEIFSREVGAS